LKEPERRCRKLEGAEMSGLRDVVVVEEVELFVFERKRCRREKVVRLEAEDFLGCFSLVGLVRE
jgi:hypothetical protein